MSFCRFLNRAITGSSCTAGQSTSACAVWWSGSLTYLGALAACNPSPSTVSPSSLHTSCSVSGICWLVSFYAWLNDRKLYFHRVDKCPVVLCVRFVSTGFTFIFLVFFLTFISLFVQQCLPCVSRSFSCLGCYLRSTLLWCVCWSRSTCTFLVELVRTCLHRQDDDVMS